MLCKESKHYIFVVFKFKKRLLAQKLCCNYLKSVKFIVRWLTVSKNTGQKDWFSQTQLRSHTKASCCSGSWFPHFHCVEHTDGTHVFPSNIFRQNIHAQSQLPHNPKDHTSVLQILCLFFCLNFFPYGAEVL